MKSAVERGAGEAVARGRGLGRGWLSVAEVSEVLGVLPVRVVRLCEGGLLPGAYADGKWPLGWRLREAGVRSLFSGEERVQRWLSLPTLARLLDCHVRTLERARVAGRLRARCLDGALGAELGWRVPECEYWRLVGATEALALGDLPKRTRRAGRPFSFSMEDDL